MGYDGRALRRARETLTELRLRHERDEKQREREIFARSPIADGYSAELAAMMPDVVRATIDGDTDALLMLETRNTQLQAALRAELERLGYAPDALDEKPRCAKCRDTGYADGELCDCLRELYAAEVSRELSSLNVDSQRFEDFDITYYDDKPDAQTGVSAQRHMAFVRNVCAHYAKTFGKNSKNLFFTGAPGLGKTYLAACIAGVVAGNGYSVVYDTIAAIFARLEDEKFGRGDDEEAVRLETRRLRECDLLIADDLGTEMQTSFTSSALYELINTRLIAHRSTILTSNLSIDDVRRRYSPQISSRIEGEYHVLPFYGRDIRVLRRERGE
ncbi:MAG: ATP-binding protein [Oscillospiraceae bacterium]|jgi:DNA replication protein DnaC|nr:ATP-binding protein [Oscillospiraceae bacterium]